MDMARKLIEDDDARQTLARRVEPLGRARELVAEIAIALCHLGIERG